MNYILRFSQISLKEIRAKNDPLLKNLILGVTLRELVKVGQKTVRAENNIASDFDAILFACGFDSIFA